MDLSSGYGEFILFGLGVTVSVTLLGSLVALAAAFAAGLGRLSRFTAVRFLAGLYIEVFRSTSFIVQLFFIYFALPLFGVTLPAFPVAVVVLGLNVGSFGAEVVRGALLSVPRPLIEAATALNYTPWQRFRHVSLPNALPRMIAPFSNLCVDLLKTSSVVSLISLSEVTFRAQIVRAQTGDTLGPFLTILVLYYVCATIIEWIFRMFERSANPAGKIAR